MPAQAPINTPAQVVEKVVEVAQHPAWSGTTAEYLTWVYIPAILWVILLVTLLVKLFRKYTFGNWSPENPNPYAMETMGIPRGAFRGILTMSLLFAVVLFEVINIKVGGQFETQVSGLLTAFQMMIAFYFGAKVMHHITSTDRSKTKMVAESITQTTAPGAALGTTFDDPSAAG
ncbi:MAG: hypothetical protein KDD54_15135 [Flavobacteriales bacterium]|nr:hypothetical protein [Flavobacteriales bacterium]